NDEGNATTLRRMAEQLPELQRPVVVVAPVTSAGGGTELARFDRVIGRNVLVDVLDGTRAATDAPKQDALAKYLASLHSSLSDAGTLVLAEPDARRAQRLYRLVDLSALGPVADSVAEAEEAIYGTLTAPSPEEVAAAARESGFAHTRIKNRSFTSRERLTRATIEGWFATGGATPTYADHLSNVLNAAQLEDLESSFLRQLADTETAWTVTYYFLTARR